MKKLLGICVFALSILTPLAEAQGLLLGVGGTTPSGATGAWSYVQGASGTEGTGGWEVQTNACGSSFGSQCTIQLPKTTPAGSDMVVGSVLGTSAHIVSAFSCASSPPCTSGNKIDTFSLLSGGTCQQTTTLDIDDCAYVAGGAGGANYVTMNLNTAPSSFEFIEYGEILPPSCSGSPCATTLDNSGSASTAQGGNSGCSPCTGPAFTLTATDGIVEIIDSNGPISSPSSAYTLDFIGNVYGLDTSSGTGISFSTGAAWSLEGVAFKTTTSYSAPVKPWSNLAPGPPSQSTFNSVSCSPTCSSITLPFTTTGTGNLIFVHAQAAPGQTQATIASMSDNKSETWTVPSGASTCKQTGGTIDLSCAFVVTTSSGVSAITPVASTSTVFDIILYEVAASSGTIALDAQNSSTSSSSSATVTGQSLSLTGASDACFAEFGFAGSGSSPFETGMYLYPLPQGSNFFGGYANVSANGVSAMSLNQRNGNAPVVLLNTAATSQESSGVCFHN